MARVEEVAEWVLGRGLTEAGRTRAAWFTALSRKLFGDAPPSAPALEVEDRAPWPPLRGSAGHRGAVETAALQVVDAFLKLELGRLGPCLDDQVWMLWSNGALRSHRSHQLLQALSDRKGTSVWAIPAEVRTCAWAELRAQLPRPAATVLDASLGLSGTMLCTMRLDATRDPIGRVMVAMAPARFGWRALTLPLPSLDTAIALSKTSFEEDWLRFADKIARQFLLHNANQLRSLRNHLMDRVLIGDSILLAEQLIELVETKDPPAERLDLVFLGTSEESYRRIDELTGLSLMRGLDRRARDHWRAPMDELRPKLAVTELGQLEPKTQAPQPAGKVVTLMVRRIEIDQGNQEIERWRVAGLFVVPS